jgi:LemA protein
VVVVAVLYFIGIYNGLVRRRNEKDNGWSQIDVQLKRRHDLIPNLVETVKGYAKHERETFDAVIQARNQAVSAQGPAAAGQAEGVLGAALGKLFALAEAYPDLKANQNFLQLQAHLKEIEDAVEAARRYYNAVVRDLNTMVEQFPSNLVAARFKFEKKEFFELETPALERRAVPVRF